MCEHVHWYECAYVLSEKILIVTAIEFQILDSSGQNDKGIFYFT